MKRTRTQGLALLVFLLPPMAANADSVTGGTDDAGISDFEGSSDKTVAIVGVVGLPDMNGNGRAEVGVVRTLPGDRVEVIIRDSDTKQLVNTVEFVGTGLDLVDVTAVDDVSGEGIPELAALFRHPDGPAVVQVKDAASGTLFNRLRFFGKEWDVKAITSFDSNYRDEGDESFRPDIGVLASRKDGTSVTVQARDVDYGLQVERIQFPADPAREYRDVTTLIDLEGSITPFVSSLSVLPDGRAKVDSIFLLSGSQDTIGLGKDLSALGASAIAVAGLDDSTDNLSPDVAVLWRKSNGQGLVQVRDVFGSRQSQMQFFGGEWHVVDMAGLPYLSFGPYLAWAGRIAVLAVRDDGTEVAVQIRYTGSGEANNWISFGNLAAERPN